MFLFADMSAERCTARCGRTPSIGLNSRLRCPDSWPARTGALFVYLFLAELNSPETRTGVSCLPRARLFLFGSLCDDGVPFTFGDIANMWHMSTCRTGSPLSGQTRRHCHCVLPAARHPPLRLSILTELEVLRCHLVFKKLLAWEVGHGVSVNKDIDDVSRHGWVMNNNIIFTQRLRESPKAIQKMLSLNTLTQKHNTSYFSTTHKQTLLISQMKVNLKHVSWND